jgi:hypothetical protein
MIGYHISWQPCLFEVEIARRAGDCFLQGKSDAVEILSFMATKFGNALSLVTQ